MKGGKYQNHDGYISLHQAAKYSGKYSQDYLSLRARQGKLKAVKLGRNWVTTKDWVDGYTRQAEAYREELSWLSDTKQKTIQKAALLKERAKESKEKKLAQPKRDWQESLMPVLDNIKVLFQPVPRARVIAVVCALVFILLSFTAVYGYPLYEVPAKKLVEAAKQNVLELAGDISQVAEVLTIQLADNVFGSLESAGRIVERGKQASSDFIGSLIVELALFDLPEIDLPEISLLDLPDIGPLFAQIDETLTNSAGSFRNFLTQAIKQASKAPKFLIAQLDDLIDLPAELFYGAKELTKSLLNRVGE